VVKKYPVDELAARSGGRVILDPLECLFHSSRSSCQGRSRFAVPLRGSLDRRPRLWNGV